ncbi:unnamed protein product [Bursaphelenchus xylophilus]|uniref:(pine wood nematode) hypothetical protein n=1 Tax=Bursaphelenchus xylophilus TaxID=6326 RepID=A0A1I7SWG4_BURXY|nr:unnamed protein product [Bursaphelenchus xylophilus]CAG9099378.1 unnamed protein product [Bursaphelenchus xylophilus]
MKRVAESDLFGPLYEGISLKKPSNAMLKPEEPETATSKLTNVACYHAELKGERETMEDYYVLESCFDVGLINVSKCAVFALFDGHAGSRCAEFCSKNIVKTLEKHVKNAGKTVEALQKNIRKIFTDTFKQLDDEFLSLARKSTPKLKDGCTATVLLFLDDVVYCANVGDSKAIVGRKKEDKVVSLSLTEEHTAIVFEERQRIQKAGGFVKDGRVMGISELSRAIGDDPLKKSGVISTPSIKKVTLTENDQFVIVACDGLWKAFTETEVINKVLSTVNEITTNSDDAAMIYSKAASILASAAVLKGCGDNVTVLLLPVHNKQ